MKGYRMKDTELLTAEEVGRKLSIQPATVLLWARSRKIPSVQISGKVVRFRWADVVAALDKANTRNGKR
jgi:excisionase family DNA binding protein